MKDSAYTKWLDRKWLSAIRERFNDREDIGRDRVYEIYFAKEGLPKEEVFECFDLIETEYGDIAGLLRPQDSLEKLFKPVPTKNPFRSIKYELVAGNRQLWFGDDLFKQMRKHGTYEQRQLIRVETVGDFVRTWCGWLPQPSSAT